MNNPSAPLSKRTFARHFGEMLLAMFLGMGILAGVAALGFAAFGGSISDQPGGVRVMLMGVSMTVPMVLWMGYRGHTRARSAEMAASMMLPTVAAAAMAWAGVLTAGAALGVQHVAMVPAMLGVMLWRYEEYARPHTYAGSRSPRFDTSSTDMVL